MTSFILALDQGTTSSRAIIFSEAGSVVAVAQKEFTQYFPQPGWVEHDPEEIWKSQLTVARSVLRKAGLKAADIAAIGITNQRESVVMWDRSTGTPVYRAIVWQDRRTADLSDRLRKGKHATEFREKTGLVMDAYFSGTKVSWMLDHVPGLRKLADEGNLAFGTVDSWLIWNLTGGRADAGAIHVTDVSNASRTLMCNIHTLDWDEQLLQVLNVPGSILPRIVSSSEVYSETSAKLFGRPIPIAGIAGDQQAALFGQMCTKPGMVKNTYGTGCFMLMNTGTQPRASSNHLLSTVAWRIGNRTEYALEGSVFIAGAAVQWLRDGLKIIKRASDVEALAAQVTDNGGVYLVPAFAGLGAPHWDPYARGIVAGLTRGSSGGHLARAALESIAYQVADVLDAMRADAGLEIKSLRVDGGAAVNNLLMQFRADLLGVPVIRPVISETTALGAAYLAGLAVGFWKNREQIQSQWQIDREFHPSMKKTHVEDLRAGWRKALERSRRWVE